MTAAADLAGCWLLLGLSGLPVDESESWESCTVTQLITLVLWLVPELRGPKRETRRRATCRRGGGLPDAGRRAHRATGDFLSSSSSESLWMVMMLTAGLGVSEMTMGCDWPPARGGALWSTEDAGLLRQRGSHYLLLNFKSKHSAL